MSNSNLALYDLFCQWLRNFQFEDRSFCSSVSQLRFHLLSIKLWAKSSLSLLSLAVYLLMKETWWLSKVILLPFRSLELQITLVYLISQSDCSKMLRWWLIPCGVSYLHSRGKWICGQGWGEDMASQKNPRRCQFLNIRLVFMQGFSKRLHASVLWIKIKRCLLSLCS